MILLAEIDMCNIALSVDAAAPKAGTELPQGLWVQHRCRLMMVNEGGSWLIVVAHGG